MMNHLLVVDDEKRIRIMIRKYAEYEGYKVTEAEDGFEAIQLTRIQDFDLVILDIMMPETDGFTAAREIRKHQDVPILMLSAKSETYDKINGFEIGIDDYITKPFSPKELMLRVAAILKRSNKHPLNEMIKFDGLEIDQKAHRVYVDGKEIHLTPKEYDLLNYLVKNSGIALTREKILTNVWGFDFYGDDRTLDTHIKLLRKNLGPYSQKIKTLRGVGYRFEA